MLLLCVNVALAALPSTFNPFTSKLDFYGVDSKVADTCVTGEISSWNGTKFTCVVGGNVTGMASWTVSNKTSSTAISDSEILNFTGGSGIRVGLSNNEITITSTVVDTDTNDSARVNSINDSLIIQTAIIDNINASVNLFQPSAYTNISALQAKPDATGSWINSTIRASTHLNVTTGGQLLVNNSGGQGYAEVRGSSAKFVLNETDYELASWSFLVSFADFFFKQETASNRSFNIRGLDNKDRLRVNLANNVTTINDTLQVTNLTSANCDLKADTSGFIYCGTDSTGGGGGVDNGITLDAQYNLTNKIGLQNSTLLACQNITGSTSNICTIVDTDTNDTGLYYTKSELDTQNLSYFSTFWSYTNAVIQNTSIWDAITSLQNKPDATGGWINNTLQTVTSLDVNTSGRVIGDNFTLVNSTGHYQTTWFVQDGSTTMRTATNIYTAGTLTSGGSIATQGDIYTEGAGDNLWLGTATEINSLWWAGANGNQNMTGRLLTNTLVITNNTAASCDLKADTNGNVYCGTDSTGAGGSADGTGGWTNTSTITSTSLTVNVSQTVIAYNISFQNTSNSVLNSLYMNPTGSAINVLGQLYANTILSSGAQIYTDGDIYTRGTGDNIWTGTSTELAALSWIGADGNANFSGQIYSNHVNTSSLTIRTATAGACDLKADSNGTVYCGTDALGGGAGVDNGIFLDAGFNLTNKIGLQNSTLLSCSNITGAASDLCTITPGGGSGDGTGGWTNYSNTIITNQSDSVVKITGALCLNAEDGTHIAPCRERWGDQENQRKFMSIQMDPFLVSGAETGEYGHWGWTSAVLGTGTDITDSDAPTVDAFGTISLGSGTLTTGSARLSTGTGGMWLNGSSGITGWFTRVYLDNAGRDAQNYTLYIGMSDGTLNLMGTDSIIALYNSSESQYWQFATCSNSACTKNISDYQVNATKWYDLEAQVYNNTLAVLYINGVNAVNLTNNIPSGSTRAFPAGRLQINKTAGTTERRMYVDYYGVYRVFDAPRW